MLNYDPDSIAITNDAQFAEATGLGFKAVHVICADSSEDEAIADPVSFIAYLEHLPRAGDRIQLEDGTVCEVKRSHYKTVQSGMSKFISLVPNVYAVKIGKKS